MGLKEAPGIIPAMDMTLGKAIVAIDKLKSLENEITGLKIGSEIIDECGFLTTKCLLEHIENPFPVIYDPQKKGNDVPEFIKRQVKLAKKYAVYSYIGHPIGSGSSGNLESPDKEIGSLQAFVKYCRQEEIEPIVVLLMSQPGADYFLREGASKELAKISKGFGVKYFVGPANKEKELKELRDVLGDDCEIISPAVGKQKTGDPVKDAEGAVYSGADHLVVGRAIYESSNPVDACKRIFEAAYNAHRKRTGR